MRALPCAACYASRRPLRRSARVTAACYRPVVGELSRYLFLAGALPYLVLGTAHAIVTPRRIDDAKGLSPRDPATRAAMERETLLLTRRTTLWLTWVGFNYSHSLGAVLLGVVVVLIGRSAESFESQGPLFVPLALVVSTFYLALGLRYWFRTPIAGISLATASFALSWLLLP